MLLQYICLVMKGIGSFLGLHKQVDRSLVYSFERKVISPITIALNKYVSRVPLGLEGDDKHISICLFGIASQLLHESVRAILAVVPTRHC